VLVHPYHERDKHRLETFVGTRLLKDNLGLVGVEVRDPSDSERIWKVQAVYAPLPRRGLGGVRTKLVDQYDFTTFCNQRDLEVLLELGTPGRYCPWQGGEYVEPGERGWYGLCADDEDLLDDLFDREMLLRQASPLPMLEKGSTITRRVYFGGDQTSKGWLNPSTGKTASNFSEEWDLLWDMDPETGMFPDTRFQTVRRRWSRTVREKVRWAEG
jgi:hypothetical protein